MRDSRKDADTAKVLTTDDAGRVAAYLAEVAGGSKKAKADSQLGMSSVFSERNDPRRLVPAHHRLTVAHDDCLRPFDEVGV